MTKKLFNSILTICLLFSSLYLPAFADTANTARTTNTKNAIKKSPEAYFLDGEACLKTSNIPCVSVSLAMIPKMSVYAKILEGALAFKQNKTDRALLLLLPIQADAHLIMPAKILLHQTLAQVFAGLGDVQQAIQHLILTEALFNQIQTDDTTNKLFANHEQIWRLLQPLNQTELAALRGNNTDNVFQGWLDLTLASQYLDAQHHIASWSTLYPDHPALNFANQLLKHDATTMQAGTSLASAGSIALMLPPQSEVEAEQVEAFKLGLQTALNLATLSNPIEVHYQQQAEPELDADTDYYILPNFSQSDSHQDFEQIANKKSLRLGFTLQDEANTMLQFARKNGMQHTTVVTTQHETSQKMLAHIQHAWQQEAEDVEFGTLNIITLDSEILAEPIKLLDLKSQIASKLHDMVILAMPAQDVVKIRPYLDTSIPTMTFSTIHDIAYENDNLKLLNALRFVEMPFLVENNQLVTDYQSVAASLTNKKQLRWFALGVDSLQLLISNELKGGQTSLIKGLAGNYAIAKTGEIKHTFISARFNQTGAIPD